MLYNYAKHEPKQVAALRDRDVTGIDHDILLRLNVNFVRPDEAHPNTLQYDHS